MNAKPSDTEDRPLNGDAPLRLDLSTEERAFHTIVALLIAGVFVVAFLLEPDPRGHGTHEKLGLRPCSFATYLKAPCPFCGMTTSFTYYAKGDMFDALKVQPAGALIALASTGYLFLVVFMTVSGRRMAKTFLRLRS